jgi:ribonucleotide monophosphatase NagD (HAD superfamily)
MNEIIDISSSKTKKVIVDIDGVLAVEKENQPYSLLLPIQQAVESLKTLKRLGFIIILHTSRFEFEKNATIAWLKANGFEYDDIKFGKPRGILYIDDRGYRFKDWESFFQDVKLT